MGAAYYTQVIVGFQVIKHTAKSTVKRYNEITGEPYTVEEPVFEQAIIGKNRFGKEESDEIFGSEKFEGLDVDYTTDQQDYVIGHVVARTNDINYTQPPIPFSVAIPESVIAFGKKYCVEPQFFVVPYCSY
jgi:hypothetical protein